MTAISKELIEQVKIPNNSTRLWKDECCYSFNTADKGEGLFIDLNSFLAFSKPFVPLNYQKTRHSVYLQIKKVVVPSIRSTDPNPSPPKKLAIGVEGGFNDEDEVKYEDQYALYIYPEDKFYDLSDPNIPSKIIESINEVKRINSQSRKEEIIGWSADQVIESKFADSLIQLDNPPRVPLKDWKCSHPGCDKVENLWLNLTDGYIGCGRQYSNGSGGNGHASRHYEETKYPLSVKLGTISKDTQPDIYSYPEDDMVSDPHFKRHIEHFGINIYNMQKTEKSMAELELDQNLNYEFGKLLEKGKELINAFGPGLTGIENLGNTCYMSSVVQMIFSTPHFLKRYLTFREQSNKEITQDPTLSFEIQMSKMAHGLESGEYSVPEQSNKAKNDQEFTKASQVGISPKMFKSLIADKHQSFSTFQQQDALEYFQYLLDIVERNEKTRPSWIKEENPVKAFNYILEERIECGSSGKVKYTRRVENVLSLPVPLDAATNKERVLAYEHQVALNDGKKDPNIEEVRPIIPLQACINTFLEPFKVDGFFSSAINNRTFSINSSKMESFPDILVIHLRKYVLTEDWTPKKLNVFIDAPDILNINDLRGNGKKPNEELLPEDDDNNSSGVSTPQPNQELVNQLVEFGFPELRCKKASLAIKNKMDVDAAMNWLLEHSEDADIDTPLPEPKKASASKMVFNPEDIMMLGAMGFSEPQAKLALEQTSNNLERASDWLCSHIDELDMLLAQSESKSSNNTNKTNNNQQPKQDTLKPKVHDGTGEYNLTGFITHVGNHVQMGHYICHIKKDGKWIKFNDRSVQVSQDPAKEFGYMFFYTRKPSFI